MKKILYSALAVSMLAACSQDELVGMQDPNAIAFAGAYIDNATRGNDPSVTATNINTFDVWGYVNNSAGHLFDGVAVNKVDGAWTYSPYATQYWYPNNTYRFFALTSNQAVEGKVSDNVVLNINDPFVNGIGEVKFTNVAGTEDLIFADCPAFQTSADINVKPAPVAFTFDHLLSKVKFTFKNGFATGLTTISVTNVKMEVPNNASITLNAQPTDKGAYTWSDFAGTTVLDFSNMGAGALVNEGASVESDNERLTFPADANQVYTVTFDVEVFQNGVSVLKRAKTTKIVGCQLLSGNAYNFVAELNQENVSDNPLYPIEFTVENVGEWTEWNENNGGVIPTNAVSTADELATALAKGGLITLMSDITTTTALQVPADVNATLNLNGKTLSGTDEGTASYGLITNKGTLTIKDSKGNGALKLTAKQNRGWNAYSSVISNQPGGKLIIESGLIEHLGGTDMAYAIDNLTNGKGTYAETIVNGGTIKSTYRAVRQFLNGVEAQNILTVNGGVIEGTNKSIWMQDPSKNANTGKLTVEGGELKGDVYLTVTAGSTVWPVEVSIKSDAVKNNVLTSNAPEEYKVILVDGYYTVINADAFVNNADELATAVANGATNIYLLDGNYTMPAITDKNVTILGSRDVVITINKPAMHGSDITLQGVTVKASGTYTGIQHVNTVTYNNVKVIGEMCLYGEKVAFNNCEFELNNQYIWTYGAKNAEFNGCEFNTNGKAILVYNEGSGATNVVVKGCKFNATAGAKAGAIANQNCAAIEIDNFQNSGKGVAHKVTATGNTVGANFSGEWRIKNYVAGNPVTVNGVDYTQIAIDGKLMTIDANKNVTVLN